MNKLEELVKACTKLPALYSTDGQAGDLPAVYIFNPAGVGTWIVWEYDPEERIAHGMCDLGFPEQGDVSLNELASISTFGIGVEIEKYTHTRFKGMENAGIPIPEYLRVPAPEADVTDGLIE